MSLPDSEQISPNNGLWGDKERDYLSKVSVALQNPPEPEVVRMWLAKAQQDGLDPQRIFNATVRIRPTHWSPAPVYEDVAPSRPD
ncbi:MAG: hypothetical protein P0121_00810 [Nitrospira sp.]|nr:hypothetical protein [Nitrospira sp.]